MKISDIVYEDKLQEGPVLNKIGSAVGKGVGTAAKAAGAVAGGVVGLGSAIKKGFQAGKSTVAGAGDDENSNVQLSPAAQKALAALKSLAPAERKAAIAALQAPSKSAASTSKPVSPTTKPTTAPKVEPKVSAPASGTAAVSNPVASKNAAGSDTYEKAKGDIRKVQGGQKPMPPNSAADIDAAIAKLAKGDKESGVFAAQKIMNLAKAGVDVSKQQQAWIANSKAGERFLTQSQYFEISKMLREHGLGWSDLGLRVHLLEGTNELFGISFR